MKKLLLFIFVFLISSKSFALITVDITRGNLNPLPIAVSSISSNNETRAALEKELKIKNLGLEISKVVENNLRTTGLFNPLNKDAFLQKPDIAHVKPRFEDWRLIKAQIFGCWSIPLGLPYNENLLVRIKLKLKRDGTVIKSEILDHVRMLI